MCITNVNKKKITGKPSRAVCQKHSTQYVKSEYRKQYDKRE